MASKFQNRLTGTIVLVALGVIILPGLLDGQKKRIRMSLPRFRWCRNRATAMNRICCRRQRGAACPAAGRRLKKFAAGDAAAPSLDPSRLAVNNNIEIDVQVPVVAAKPVEKPQPKPQPKPAGATPTPPPAASQKQQPPAAAGDPASPTGKACVVQLGALKNADKVNEVVGKLRSSGFKVYTSPSTPVQK